MPVTLRIRDLIELPLHELCQRFEEVLSVSSPKSGIVRMYRRAIVQKVEQMAPRLELVKVV